MKRLLILGAIAAIAPLAAQAESNYIAGTGVSTVSARLNFKVIVPKVLFLQVGTGAFSTTQNNTTVDTLSFDVPSGSIGSGTAVAGTGGDLSNGSVTVRALGNAGEIRLSSSVSGALSNGTAGAPTVSWNDIRVTAEPLTSGTTTGYTNTAISHPPFNTQPGGGVSATPTTLTSTTGIVRQEGKWTFAYANTTALPPGTYGYASAAAANNGTVTYTLLTP
ncbi:hypothetical protein GCM10023165_38040 [Variovorax defluvii]|uniref:WxL domain-containing protein n=1 Tax=Variovorax defluvii TaxID=913761 RepID=A0ABP8I3G2_9BURK